ncbi:MAG: TIGR04282 family arsenosugar biosynthesis glycosyltransferase [Cyclobacteriaceae bacterium]|nr:TIGR04282 family arsenosugar biosynthesis glycosyltransferase [Cyclobacteriaceae bacterium]
MSKNLLIVFVKNLIPGMVKQRLAKDIGTDLALEVYKELVANTAEVAQSVKDVDKAVYYSEYVEMWDFFDGDHFQKHLQEGNDLGQRMLNALYDAFENGYEKVVLMGSDIPDISKKILQEAFQQLDNKDVVIGPAEDGGYYLIGMKDAHAPLFEGKTYSHGNVLAEVREAIDEEGLEWSELKMLFDLDTKEDMDRAGIKIVYEEEDEDTEGDDGYADEDYL